MAAVVARSRPSVGSGTVRPAVIAEFDYETIPGGYYDAVYRRRRGIQSK
jgi:hypothetical protein